MARKSISLVERAPRGKTIELDLDLRVDGKCYLESVKISGDFFVYPSSAIDKLEESLKGCDSASCIEEAFTHVKDSKPLGFTWSWLKEIIMKIFHEHCTEYSTRTTKYHH